MFQEVIVCDKCGSSGCTVHELAAQAPVTMTAMKEKYSDNGKPRRPAARAFEMKCSNCGYIDRFVLHPRKANKPVPDSRRKEDKPIKPLKTKKSV